MISMFGEFGLAASLIQKRTEITRQDLEVGFTLQQLFTTVIVVVLWVAAPRIVDLYPDSSRAIVWLVRTLAFTLYLTSWRTISALQLERHLSFRKLAASKSLKPAFISF
jgi:hypothetical protein